MTHSGSTLQALSRFDRMNDEVRKVGRQEYRCELKDDALKDSGAHDETKPKRSALGKVADKVASGARSVWRGIAGIFSDRENLTPERGGMNALAEKRSTWKAVAPRHDAGELGTPKAITVHETEGESHSCNALKGFQRGHQNRKNKDGTNWPDIGYHYLLCQNADGKWVVKEGRARSKNGKLMTGNHAQGNNSNNIGVAVVGLFHPEKGKKSGDVPPEALALLAKTVATLKKEYSTISSLYSHGQLHVEGEGNGHTNCMKRYKDSLAHLRQGLNLAGNQDPKRQGAFAALEDFFRKWFYA